MELVALLIPIGVCVVMPVMVVWLVTRAGIKKNEQKMAVLVKAIENGVEIDPELLVSETESSRNTNRNTKMKLIKKLTAGIVCSIIGIALLVCPSLEAFDGVARLEMLYIIGGVMVAIGVAYMVAFFVGRKYLAPEIEAEERKLNE